MDSAFNSAPVTKILKNAARCKLCGDTIESRHVHDYVSCGCGAIAVDGGREYLRRVGHLHHFEDLSRNHSYIRDIEDRD